jgi:hypothetical protein
MQLRARCWLPRKHSRDLFQLRPLLCEAMFGIAMMSGILDAGLEWEVLEGALLGAGLWQPGRLVPVAAAQVLLWGGARLWDWSFGASVVGRVP